MKRTSLALLLVAAASVTLSGCATSWVVDSDVKSFSSLSTVPPGATYRFERLPSQQADTARQDSLEAMAAAALEKWAFAATTPSRNTARRSAPA